MLNKINDSNTSLAIEIPVLILMGLGTVFIFSAGATVTAVEAPFDVKHILTFTTFKQLVFFPLAVIVMYTVSCIDCRLFSFTRGGIWKSFTPYLLILSAALLIAALIPGVGSPKNNSWRWLELGIGPVKLSFQPSELAKWSTVIFMATALDYAGRDIRNFLKGFLPICAIPAVLIALIIKEDFGTGAFITLLVFLLLIIGGAKWRHFFTPLPLMIPAFYFMIATSPYRMERLRAFFFEDSDSTAKYHAAQSLIAVSTGGLWGKGLGRGISKFEHLPEDTTDFIFAVIGEELGFVGAFFVIAMFVMFILAAIRISNRCRCPFTRILSGGIAMTIALQAAINIGVVTNLLPTKGIPLPFISSGGSSLLLTAAATGILINIARQTQTEVEFLFHNPEHSNIDFAAKPGRTGIPRN